MLNEKVSVDAAAFAAKVLKLEQDKELADRTIGELSADISALKQQNNFLKNKLEETSNEKDYFFKRCCALEEKASLVAKGLLDMLNDKVSVEETKSRFAPSQEQKLLAGMEKELGFEEHEGIVPIPSFLVTEKTDESIHKAD